MTSEPVLRTPLSVGLATDGGTVVSIGLLSFGKFTLATWLVEETTAHGVPERS
jgi:hypothetical protein